MLNFCVLQLLTHFRINFRMLLNVLLMHFFW